MQKIKKVQDVIASVSLVLAAIGLATSAVSVMISVLCRYVFKTSAMWVEQYTRYMLIWVVFIASNVLIYKNELMRVDFADSIWPKSFLRVREGVYSVLFVIILVVLFWQGWKQAISYWGVAVIGLPIDRFWVYLSIPVGAFLMMIQYFCNLVVIFLKRNDTGDREQHSSAHIAENNSEGSGSS